MDTYICVTIKSMCVCVHTFKVYRITLITFAYVFMAVSAIICCKNVRFPTFPIDVDAAQGQIILLRGFR